MKKIIIMILLILLVGMSSCKQKSENVETEKKYYQSMVMNEDKHLYTFKLYDDGSLDYIFDTDEAIIATAIQGLFARSDAKFYLIRNEQDKFWLNDISSRYGITYEAVDFDSMINMYKNKFGNEYVLFDLSSIESYNSATSLAGALDIIPVNKSIESKMIEKGFSCKIDATNMSEAKCFKNYKEYFNNGGLLQLGFNDSSNCYYLRDYSIACKYFVTYQKDLTDPDSQKLRAEVLDWVEDDSPIFGWVLNDENTDILIASNYSLYTLASDYCVNMSIFSCTNVFGEDIFKQKNAYKEGIEAQSAKHYVTFIMSDGDNLQIWYNSFLTNYLGCSRHDNFKFAWSIQPSLSDLGGNFLTYAYDIAGQDDQFVCAVSGFGYMNPTNYQSLDSFTESLDTYLAKTDLNVIEILDSRRPSTNVIEAYAQCQNLKGAFYCYGDKYAGGAGSVYWSNGVPFVCIRESMWEADIVEMAKRINSYAKDPTSIEGYTAINVHAWSMTYEDCYQLSLLLDENVEIVWPSEFIELIRNNVPQNDYIMGDN